MAQVHKGWSLDYGEGREKKKKEDWRNLMNIPSGSERGTIYRHQGLPAENSTEKWFQKLQKSEGICRQTEYASRPVHERVREQAACMWACFCQRASFHTEASPPIWSLQKKRQCKPESIGKSVTKIQWSNLGLNYERELPESLTFKR